MSRPDKPDFDVFFPASSANLGPCFDAAALALDFGLRVRAWRAGESALSADGRDVAICGLSAPNLILETCREVLAGAGRRVPPLVIHLDNQIPVGKGCGSSAAAILAGIALATKFGDLHWDAERIFATAARREGHPDNVAACWWGGLVVTAAADGAYRWVRIPVSEPWPLLLAVPPQPLGTEQARRALPAQYIRADAVANLQNALLLTAAFARGRGELLAAAFADRMHQPYRAPLCPLLPALQPLVGSHGILGCALSGAGPSVLLVIHSVAELATAQAAMATQLAAAGLEAELLPAAITARGPGVAWR